MRFSDIDRRLRLIEADRGGTAPTAILSSEPLPEPSEPDPLAGALANRRKLVADGRASSCNGVLCISSPMLTMTEWADRFCADQCEHPHWPEFRRQ